MVKLLCGNNTSKEYFYMGGSGKIYYDCLQQYAGQRPLDVTFEEYERAKGAYWHKSYDRNFPTKDGIIEYLTTEWCK